MTYLPFVITNKASIKENKSNIGKNHFQERIKIFHFMLTEKKQKKKRRSLFFFRLNARFTLDSKGIRKIWKFWRLYIIFIITFINQPLFIIFFFSLLFLAHPLCSNMY